MPERFVTRVAATMRHVTHVIFGIIVIVAPTETVVEQVRWGAYIWAALFIVGGAVGAYGAARRKWITERWALVPEMVGWLVYIAALVFRWVADGGIAVLAVAIAFGIIVQSLIVRAGELTEVAEASARRETR